MRARAINIVGAGRVGSTLARLWNDAGVFAVQDVVNATRASAARAVKFIGAGRSQDEVALLRPAPVWLIGVHDSLIQPTAERLAAHRLVGDGDIVFHCSGSLGARALSALSKRGAFTASIHPVKSFVAPLETLAAFAGTWCALEGDPEALAELEPALKAIDARVLTIDTANKLLYHAASVFSCNYLSVLIEVALRSIEASGVDRETGLELLEPLVRGTVDNLFGHGPASALSGPIARGDHELVARQLAAVTSWNDDHGRLYRELGRIARELAEENGQVSELELKALSKILDTRRGD